MAEVVMAPLLSLLFERCASLLMEGFGLSWGVKRELQKLKSILSAVRSVIEDAEEKQLKDRAIRDWLAKLKEAAHDAEDLLDEFEAEALTLKFGSSRKARSGQVCSLFSLPMVGFIRRKLRCKIGVVVENFDAIARERSDFYLREGDVAGRHFGDSDRQNTHSFVNELDVVGRMDDRENIVQLLLSPGCDGRSGISVIPIVGMGGLGKTTLAQLAYGDARVIGHFDLRLWVTVSDDFDVVKLTRMVVELASGAKCDVVVMDFLQQRVREVLEGRRFLLVLDDVWNENRERWERLESLLRCGGEGSKIVVTTRSKVVAKVMCASKVYHLKHLSEDDCWTLFKQRAFADGREDRSHLIPIGKEIVKKCEGVPLAAKVLGSVMQLKRDLDEWLYIKQSEIWNIPEDEIGILPVLKLSYHNLPLHLRRCFSYCSIIPKGSEIKKEQLIQLWMANGFIQSRGDMDLEVIGNQIFNDLLWRSVFQDTHSEDDEGVIKYKMHDLMHDLARSTVKNECFILDASSNVNGTLKRIRHMSIVECSSSSILCEVLNKSRTLHTFLLPLEYRFKTTDLSLSIWLKLKFLRVLDLHRAYIKELPVPISNLKHLRYLDLSGTNVEILPEEISELVYMQTLKLDDCPMLVQLPKGLRKMSSLRHLHIDGCISLSRMPKGMGQLSCLRTLTTFIVGKKSGCGIGELRGLNLHGTINLCNLGNARTMEDAKAANLIGKKNLKSLSLSWEHSSDGELQESVIEVIGALQPHANLRKLKVMNYSGFLFPSWMMEASFLPNLVEMELSLCRRCTHLPPLSQLPLLKVLYINGMDALEYIGSDFYGTHNDKRKPFPSLQMLTFNSMPNLERWEGHVVDGRHISSFSCLVSLVIEYCPMLTAMPCLPMVQNLHIREGNAMLLNAYDERNYEMLGTEVCLKTLSISSCKDVVSLPREVMSCLSISLQELKIDNCENLTSLSDGLRCLTVLKKLEISNCSQLASLPLLPDALQLLSIQNCEMMSFLPEVLQQTASLQELVIGGFFTLAVLPKWLGNLTSLKELHIWNCPSLMRLPEEVLHLPRLEKLYIYECLQLARRYGKDKGEDWELISHIADVEIVSLKVLEG